MKKLLTTLIFVLCSPALADCVSLDYQEMKDMKLEDLTKEYCKVKSKAAESLSDSATERKFASDMNNVNSISYSSERSKEITKSYEKASILRESADQCKSQESRIERVLTQKGVDEVAIKELCKPEPKPVPAPKKVWYQ